nr:hypothetical protein [Tanacetum cinerariifolium]
MAECENRSPQQPPQPYTEYGFRLMIQLILGRPLFSVKIGRMAQIATSSGYFEMFENIVCITWMSILCTWSLSRLDKNEVIEGRQTVTMKAHYNGTLLHPFRFAPPSSYTRSAHRARFTDV